MLANIILTFSTFKPAPQFHVWNDYRFSCYPRLAVNQVAQVSLLTNYGT